MVFLAAGALGLVAGDYATKCRKMALGLRFWGRFFVGKKERSFKKATIVFYCMLSFTVVLNEPGCGWFAAARMAKVLRLN